MIGKIIIGKSFKNCIAYCLKDKQNLSGEMSVEELQLQHKNRAEILEYNKCFGNIKELTEQMNDVKNLSRRIEKPVMHITLRMAPEDRPLSKNELIEIGRKCAEEFGVADHQYLNILHKDTAQQHIHLVINRVGFDGKAASDSNNYRKMAAFCRSIEKEYHLTEVLSPGAFLSFKERLIPRQDARKKKLKNDIAGLLKSEQIKSYDQFAQGMKSLGYRIEKGRGIAFIDNKNVRIKGSEVGFSLSKIEKILSLKMEISLKENAERQWSTKKEPESQNPHQRKEFSPQTWDNKQSAFDHNQSQIEILQSELKNILYLIMKPEMGGDDYLPEELSIYKRKKRRKRMRW